MSGKEDLDATDGTKTLDDHEWHVTSPVECHQQGLDVLPSSEGACNFMSAAPRKTCQKLRKCTREQLKLTGRNRLQEGK